MKVLADDGINEYVESVIEGKTTPNITFIASTISDVSGLVLRHEESKQILVAKGVIRVNEPSSVISRRISQLIFCPNHDVSKVINETVKSAQGKKLIGYQLRTGGSLANSKEKVSFLTLDRIPAVCKKINRSIRSSTAVYVSTDSFTVLSMIKNCTNNHILYMTEFERGHSSPARNNVNLKNAMRGAICDLGVLSHSKELYITNHSSYGGLASVLSDAIVYRIWDWNDF